MEEGNSLDDILGDEEIAEEQEAPTGPQRDEHGRFASARQPEESEEQGEEQQEAPPASEQPEPGHIPIAALKDERSKRQRAEEAFLQAQERLQQYEAYFQQQSQQQPDEEIDPIELIAQQVVSRVQPQTQQQLLAMKVEVAEQFARSRWADYDEKVETFKEEAQRNPYLWQELAKAPNPAEYAYNAAANILSARSYGSDAPPSREQIEAEIREKIMAEIGMSKPAVPSSLANAQSRGSRGGPAWSGPSPIEDILGR